jgi:hypothetical protein
MSVLVTLAVYGSGSLRRSGGRQRPAHGTQAGGPGHLRRKIMIMIGQRLRL